MKIVILFAVAGCTASLHTYTTPLPLLTRAPQLALLRSSSITDLSPRAFRSEALSLHPRGLGSKLATCIGKLCGKKQAPPDQSVRGPGLARTNPDTSSGGAAVQVASLGSTNNQNTLPSNARPRSSSPPPRRSRPTHSLPMAPWEAPSGRFRSRHPQDDGPGSRGTYPPPVAIGWNASPSTWDRSFGFPGPATGSTTSSSQNSPRNPAG